MIDWDKVEREVALMPEEQRLNALPTNAREWINFRKDYEAAIEGSWTHDRHRAQHYDCYKHSLKEVIDDNTIFIVARVASYDRFDFSKIKTFDEATGLSLVKIFKEVLHASLYWTESSNK